MYITKFSIGSAASEISAKTEEWTKMGASHPPLKFGTSPKCGSFWYVKVKEILQAAVEYCYVIYAQPLVRWLV